MEKTLTVGTDGWVTLVNDMLDHLGVAPGEEIVIDFLPSGRAEIQAAQKPISRFFGSLCKEGTAPLTIAEIHEIIADGWAGIHE